MSALSLLAACGGAKLPAVLHAAPEPESAAAPAGVPAGLVRALRGAQPEGVAVDASSRYAVVATRQPAALQIIDTATLQVIRTIPIPGEARHLELTTDGEHVIVPMESVDMLGVYSIPDGTLVSEVKVGRQPHDATEIGDTIVVGDELGGQVTATRGDTSLTTLGGLFQPGGVANADGLAAVVDVRARLLDIYAVDPLRFVSRIAIGAGPTHDVGLGDGLVAVADTTGDAMLIVRVSAHPAVVAQFPVPDGPYGLAVDLPRHRLWVASSGDDTVRMFTLGAPGSVPKLGPTYLSVQQPNSLAVVPSTGDVIVAGATPQGQLQEITP